MLLFDPSLTLSGREQPKPFRYRLCSCCSRRLVSSNVLSTLGLRGGGGGGIFEQDGSVGLITDDGESGCDLLTDVRLLRGTGGGRDRPSSLVVDASDSVEVQPLVRPPTLL